MRTASFSLREPIRDDADFLALARAVLAAAGVDVALPTPSDFTAPTDLTFALEGGGRVDLTNLRRDPDPYAGGSKRERSVSLEEPGGLRLRVSIDEIVWVGDELRSHAFGPASRVEPVAEVVRAFAAAWA